MGIMDRAVTSFLETVSGHTMAGHKRNKDITELTE
jgi:hypothetical protein